MAVTPDDARRPLRKSPLRRLMAELYCFLLVFWFHDSNNDARKAVTIMVVAVWGALELGSAFGAATLPDQFFYFRVVVGILVGRMWNIQINNFAGVEFSDQPSDEDSNE